MLRLLGFTSDSNSNMWPNLTVPTWPYRPQVIQEAKTFLDSHSTAAGVTGEPLQDVSALISEVKGATDMVKDAHASKVEAMLVQAFKSSVKATQKDLVLAQVANIAGNEFLTEAAIQPALLSWGKNLLD